MELRSPPPRLWLVSGLSIDRDNSFRRQLSLLGATLSERGVCCRVTDGRSGELPAAVGPRDACILLGYPDQFAFFHDDPRGGKLRIGELPPAAPRWFLWAQTSRPPRQSEAAWYRHVQPVALTARTRGLLSPALDGVDIPVIPHAVDAAVFVPPPLSRAGAPVAESSRPAFVVGCVGANSYRKRFDRIFEAIRALRELARHAAPERTVKCIVKTDRIVGADGTDLAALAARCGVADAVDLREGELSSSKMAELFRSFDAYLNLSEWEGFCVPVIEAMASGVPVVAHRGQGPGELVPYRDLLLKRGRWHSEHGAALLDADAGEAAAALLRLCMDRRFADDLAAEGRSAVEERFDLSVVASKWLDLTTTGYSR